MSMPIGHFEPESAAIQESNEAIEPLVDIILGKLFILSAICLICFDDI